MPPCHHATMVDQPNKVHKESSTASVIFGGQPVGPPAHMVPRKISRVSVSCFTWDCWSHGGGREDLYLFLGTNWSNLLTPAAETRCVPLQRCVSFPVRYRTQEEADGSYGLPAAVSATGQAPSAGRCS
jgi:hypothetical protein